MDSPVSKRSFGARIFGSARGKLETFAARQPTPTRAETYRTTLMNLDDYLPQPEEDRKIASKVKHLQGLIEAHAVQVYYHNRLLRLEAHDIRSILQKRLFRSDDEETAIRLANNLLRPSHRATFIRIVIARALIAGINLHGEPATSLLPEEIVLFMTAFKNTPRLKDDDAVDDVALCEWRRLGLYLLTGAQDRTVQLQNAAARIDLMVGSLDEILCPFAEPEHVGAGGSRRLGNLRSIVSTATDLGVLLFGQPCGWELDWKRRPTNDTQGADVVPNGLHRVNSQMSQHHSSALTLRSPTSLRDVLPEQPQEQRKRRRRLIGRSHSTKEKEEEKNEKTRKDRDRPPLASSILRLQSAQQESGFDGEAQLYRIRTGEAPNQHRGSHHQIPQPHYQYHDSQRLEEQEGLRYLKERSRSEPHFTPIYQQEATHHRNVHETPSPLKEVDTVDTNDSFSFKGGAEDALSSTLPDNKHEMSLQSPQPDHERQDLPSRHIGVQGSFPKDSLEQSRYTRDPRIVPPSRPGRPIVYFPALLKVNDEYGCKMPQPLMVLEPMIDRTFLTPWY